VLVILEDTLLTGTGLKSRNTIHSIRNGDSVHISQVKLSDGHVPRHNRPEREGGLRSRDFYLNYIGKRQFGKADDTEQLERGAREEEEGCIGGNSISLYRLEHDRV
jgi:hypothetical protein